jgi:hypothetical protein
MFQEIPFNSLRGESLTKTLPTDSRTGQKHYTLRNFVAWGSVNLGLDPDLPDTILKGDHLRTIVTKFGFNWPGSFRGEDL